MSCHVLARAGQVRAGQVGSSSNEVRSYQARAGQGRVRIRAGQIRSFQGEVRSEQVRSKSGQFKIRSCQVKSCQCQVRSCEIKPCQGSVGPGHVMSDYVRSMSDQVRSRLVRSGRVMPGYVKSN